MRITHHTPSSHTHTHNMNEEKKKHRYNLACKRCISADVVEWSQDIQYANRPIFQEAQ